MLSKFNIPNNVSVNNNIFAKKYNNSSLINQKIQEFKSEKKVNLNKLDSSDIMMNEDFKDYEEEKEHNIRSDNQH